MKLSESLHYLELLEVSNLIHSKQISSMEATQAQLSRIEEVDPQLRSYACMMTSSALEEAKHADEAIAKGKLIGPLHGVPIAVKDLCWTAGVTTAAGMTIYSGNVPKEDGTVVRKLREAGAVILGKLQLTEGAYADHHPKITPPVNPWNAQHWTGVSSSGSGVATAAGLCYASIGSDTGGSIRFPSAANGVTGIKPTWGRVSRYGAFELAATLDHLGPMARCTADAAAMLGAIAGADLRDPTASLLPVPDYLSARNRGIKGLRIGIDLTWSHHNVDQATQRVFNSMVEVVKSLGATVVEVKFPDTQDMINDWFPLCGAECAVAHETTYPSRKKEYGDGLAGLIDLGHALTGMEYQKIMLRRHAFRGQVARLFQSIDLLLIPTTGVASPTLERMKSLATDADLLAALLKFTCPFDMTGQPTITVPAGLTDQGMPVGCQFVANHFEEEMLVQAGCAFESATDWHRHHPSI